MAVSEPDPFGSIGNLVGGGILVIVAVYIVRLMVKGSERVEAMWTNALEAASKRAEEAEARSARLQAENDELRQRIKEWSPHDSEG